MSEFKSVAELATEVKTAFGDQIREVAYRVDDLEQKVARKGSGVDGYSDTAGAIFTKNADVLSFISNPHAGRRVGIDIDQKAIISALTTDANGSAGDLIVPQRGSLIGLPRRRLRVRNLIPSARTSSSTIQFPKATGYTNSAATVTETAGTAKAQSEIKFDIATANVTTIAHWVLATRQILDDVPALQGYIDDLLRYGLAYAEESQLLNGGGTGTDLTGVYTAATAFSAPFTLTAPTKIDIIALAMQQVSNADFEPTGIVVNNSDWLSMRLLKNADNEYILGPPSADVEPRLFGLPVVATPAMAADKYLVADFQAAAQIFDRWDARVEISTEDSDNFRKNLVTILAEERLALAIKQTAALVKGDFSDSITAATTP